MRALRWPLVALVIAAGALPARPAEPTSPETRAEMIRLIDTLEKHPNAPNARDMRARVLSWLTEAPDVAVSICGEYLDMVNFTKNGPGGDLVLQQPFAEAKFILENPDKAQDPQAVHMAGVEGALRTYAVMKSENPKLLIPPMEKLVKLQADGKLPQYIAKAAEKCG